MIPVACDRNTPGRKSFETICIITKENFPRNLQSKFRRISTKLLMQIPPVMLKSDLKFI